RERRNRRLEGIDLPDDGAVLFQQALVTAAENAGQDVDHEIWRYRPDRKKQGVRTASPLMPLRCDRSLRKNQHSPLGTATIALGTATIALGTATCSTWGAQKSRRILRDAIHAHFEVQVWTGRTARRAHRRHLLAAHHEIAFVDVDLGCVGVTGNQAVAVI